MSQYDDPTEHPFWCQECEGRGGWLAEYAASIVAVSPSTREIECETCCGTGYHEFAVCRECSEECIASQPSGWHLCGDGEEPLCTACAELSEMSLHTPGCTELAVPRLRLRIGADGLVDVRPSDLDEARELLRRIYDEEEA